MNDKKGWRGQICYLNRRCVLGLGKELGRGGSSAPRATGGQCDARVCGLDNWADYGTRFTGRWQGKTSSLSCSLLSGRNCCKRICGKAAFRVRFSTWKHFFYRCEAKRSLYSVLLLLRRWKDLRLKRIQAAGSPQRAYRHRQQNNVLELLLQFNQIWKQGTQRTETCRNSFLSPGGLAGLSTWKNPPSKTTGLVG